VVAPATTMTTTAVAWASDLVQKHQDYIGKCLTWHLTVFFFISLSNLAWKNARRVMLIRCYERFERQRLRLELLHSHSFIPFLYTCVTVTWKGAMVR
jgi:hypothetical protein